MITTKIYKNAELGLLLETVMDQEQNVYFKGKEEVALALGYKRPRDAFNEHVRSEDKRTFERERYETALLINYQPHQIFSNEPGLYAMIFGSKLPSAKIFLKWVFEAVLPAMRKYGYYSRKLDK